MLNNRTFLLLIFVFLVGFSIGCSHGGKKMPQPEPAVKEQTNVPETVDAAIDDAEDEEDFFEEDEDEEFVVEELHKEDRLVADPLYYFNISMYHFNDKLYFWCLKPVGTAYKYVTPNFFRVGVRNFSNFLITPARFVSCLLQGKMKAAGTETGRLLINATLGFGGVIDTAKHGFQINQVDEDLGQVMGAYGIGNGFYLYLPFLGPSTLRDSVGAAGAYFLDPVLYLENRNLALGYSGVSRLNSVSFMIGDYEAVKAASIDPYTMIRDFYIEQRNRKIRE